MAHVNRALAPGHCLVTCASDISRTCEYVVLFFIDDIPYLNEVPELVCECPKLSPEQPFVLP